MICATTRSLYHDSVELRHDKGQSRLLNCLCKCLLLDHEVAKCDGVLGQKSSQGAGTILNREIPAILLQI